MRCEAAREAWSAQMDGEGSPVTTEALEAHLDNCPACTRYAAATAALHRRVRVRAAEPVPDRTAAITAAVVDELPERPAQAPMPRQRPARVRAAWARPALLVAALTQLALALPELLFGDDHGAGIHVAREQGSWDVALAVALLVVVWRPSRAGGLLPFLSALAVVLFGTALLDVSQGRAPALGELHHLLDVAGIVFLWLLTPPDPNRPSRHGLRSLPRLHRAHPAA